MGREPDDPPPLVRGEEGEAVVEEEEAAEGVDIGKEIKNKKGNSI